METPVLNRVFNGYVLVIELIIGALFFECNPGYVPATVTMLSEIGFTEVQTREDQFGKLRFVKAGKYEK